VAAPQAQSSLLPTTRDTDNMLQIATRAPHSPFEWAPLGAARQLAGSVAAEERGEAPQLVGDTLASSRQMRLTIVEHGGAISSPAGRLTGKLMKRAGGQLGDCVRRVFGRNGAKQVKLETSWRATALDWTGGAPVCLWDRHWPSVFMHRRDFSPLRAICSRGALCAPARHKGHKGETKTAVRRPIWRRISSPIAPP